MSLDIWIPSVWVVLIHPTIIPAYKTALSLPFTDSENHSICPLSVVETPQCTELRHYFVRHLHPKNTTPAKKIRKCTWIIHATGGALKADEVIQCLQEKETQKKSKTLRKKVVASTSITHLDKHSGDTDWSDEDDKDCSHCFICGRQYEDSDALKWISCDAC